MYELNLDIDFWNNTVNNMASLSIVWITDAMLNIFLYIANEKCENMSSHSEKYPSSFIHHVP